MARRAITTGGATVIVQGFRSPNWEAYPPYVYVGVLGDGDELEGEFTFGLGQANELGEILRQEAEFAATSRAEGEVK